MTARIFPALSMEKYQADDLAPEIPPSLSSGLAKLILAKSPLHAWRVHPRLGKMKAQKDDDDDRFDIGTAAHSLLLEGDVTNVVVVDEKDWKKNVAKEARDAAHAAGKVALLKRQFVDVEAMVEAAERFIAASEFADDWKGGTSEVTIAWEERTEDGALPVWCRVRIDRLTADRAIIFDYKSAASAHPRDFGRSIASYYVAQNGLYRRGVEALTGKPPRFIFLAQEKSAPYDCTWHEADPAMQAAADAQALAAIREWRIGMTTGQWRGYSAHVHHQEPPSWMLAEFEGGY